MRYQTYRRFCGVLWGLLAFLWATCLALMLCSGCATAGKSLGFNRMPEPSLCRYISGQELEKIGEMGLLDGCHVKEDVAYCVLPVDGGKVVCVDAAVILQSMGNPGL